MAQLEHIEAIEKRLWSAADTLRANSNYASNEYFLPVMGFLRRGRPRLRALELRRSVRGAGSADAAAAIRGNRSREFAF